MYLELLQQLGLNQGESEIYSLLVKNGPQSVQSITKQTEISRTNTYNILNSLERQGLIEQKKEKSKTEYHPLHPNKLADLLRQKEKSLQLAEANLQAGLPALISDYHLAVGKPGIKFYEGKEGLRKVLEDSLKSSEEILSYVDNKSIEGNKYFLEEDKKYVAKRKNLGIKKRILVKDSPENREMLSFVDPQITAVRFIDYNLSDFQVVMYIYENKISYLTLREDKMIGVILEDDLISRMHRDLFNAQWRNAKAYSSV